MGLTFPNDSFAAKAPPPADHAKPQPIVGPKAGHWYKSFPLVLGSGLLA